MTQNNSLVATGPSVTQSPGESHWINQLHRGNGKANDYKYGPEPTPPSLAVPDEKMFNDPRQLFVHLTKWVVTFGHEKLYYGAILKHLGFEEDTYGNWFLEIPYPDNHPGSGFRPKTAFTCHMDTAAMYSEPVEHVFVGDEVTTDGTTILGADDRAGMTILFYMIAQKIPGLYCLFSGEEVGCLGSKKASEYTPEKFNHLDRMISFDRRGTDSVVTHQCGERTCSKGFAKALCRELKTLGFDYTPDNTGIFTDSREFMYVIPECTNLSVGYEHAHCHHETQDLDFLEVLCDAACLIEWDVLPTIRDNASAYLDHLEEESRWSKYRGGSSTYAYWKRDGAGSYVFVGENDDDEDEQTATYEVRSGSYSNFSSAAYYDDEMGGSEYDPDNLMDGIIEDFQAGFPSDPFKLRMLLDGESAVKSVGYIEELLNRLQKACL